MRYIKKTFLLLMILSTSYLSSNEEKESVPSSTNNSEFIYIQQAKVAELTVNPDRLGYYLLKVKGSDQTLVYFSDKPDRVAGTLSLSQFVKKWQNSALAKEDFPNAVISYVNFKASSDKGVGADILQLSNPQYDPGTDTISFLAKPLHEFEIMTGVFENLVLVYDGLENVNKEF